MPIFEGKFFSIIFLGRQNPQILNHDFLINNKILPEDVEPFDELLLKEKPKQFTEFVSTPILTAINYNFIKIIIEENRYQITDLRFLDPLLSPIIPITKKYFGEILKYTPLKLGGINLNGIIKFADKEDEEVFDKQFGLYHKNLLEIFGDGEDIRLGLTLSFPWNKGILEVNLPKNKDCSEPGAINFNYEFKYENMDSFIKNLDDLEIIYDKFNNILDKLSIGRK